MSSPHVPAKLPQLGVSIDLNLVKVFDCFHEVRELVGQCGWGQRLGNLLEVEQHQLLVYLGCSLGGFPAQEVAVRLHIEAVRGVGYFSMRVRDGFGFLRRRGDPDRIFTILVDNAPLLLSLLSLRRLAAARVVGPAAQGIVGAAAWLLVGGECGHLLHVLCVVWLALHQDGILFVIRGRIAHKSVVVLAAGLEAFPYLTLLVAHNAKVLRQVAIVVLELQAGALSEKLHRLWVGQRVHLRHIGGYQASAARFIHFPGIHCGGCFCCDQKRRIITFGSAGRFLGTFLVLSLKCVLLPYIPISDSTSYLITGPHHVLGTCKGSCGSWLRLGDPGTNLMR